MLGLLIAGGWEVFKAEPPVSHVEHLTNMQPPAYHGPCQLQAAQWYHATGQSDLTALAAADQAVVDVQMTGTNEGLPHVSTVVGQAASNAIADPPPACIDKLGAWETMAHAEANLGVDLYLANVDDGTAQANTAIAALREFKSELPAAWFVKYGVIPPVPVTASTGGPPGTSCSTAGDTAAWLTHGHDVALICVQNAAGSTMWQKQ